MQQDANALAKRWGIYIAMAGSITLATSLPMLAAQPVNTMNDGRIVKGGEYYNTADGKTTFTNSGSGGLWVQEGVTVRGLEANANGNQTNNGGTLHFLAPGSVVRIDGKVDVSGVLSGNGGYLGDGGKVFVDSAFLYQSGHIYANGNNGGLVQMNVGSAVFAPGSSIEAKGFGGNGGAIAINSDGLVKISNRALLDSSGRVAGTFDSNLINIEGGAIYNAGILRADGVVPTSASGAIPGTRGGTIRLVATGNTNLNQMASALNDAANVSSNDPVQTATISQTQAQQLKTSANLMRIAQDGSIVNEAPSSQNPTGGLISATGSQGPVADNNDYIQDSTQRAGDGGTISLTAMNHVTNRGKVTASGGDGLLGDTSTNGGNGGAIVVLANGSIINSQDTQSGYRGRYNANGGRGGKSLNTTPASTGGNGGLLAFSYGDQMINSGVIQAIGGVGGAGGSAPTVGTGGTGGQGGLIVLSGNANPIGGGYLDANGGWGGSGLVGGNGGLAGTIVAPVPNQLSHGQIAFQSDGGKGASLGQSTPSPIGQTRPLNQITAENELLTHGENLILLTRNEGGLRKFTLRDRAESAKIRSVLDPKGLGVASREIAAKEAPGTTLPYRNLIIGSSANDLSLVLNREPVFITPDSEVNLYRLNTLTVLNNGYTTNTFGWSVGDLTHQTGGRISILATGDIENGTGFNTSGRLSGGSINLASKTNISNYDVLGTSNPNDGTGVHGGSLMLNARQSLFNAGFRTISTSGGMIGGTQRFNANGDFLNLGDFYSIAYNTAPGTPITGGNIHVRAGTVYQGGSDDYNPVFVQANAMSNNQGYGGYVSIHAQTVDNTLSQIEANGSQQNGTVITGSP